MTTLYICFGVYLLSMGLMALGAHIRGEAYPKPIRPFLKVYSFPVILVIAFGCGLAALFETMLEVFKEVYRD